MDRVNNTQVKLVLDELLKEMEKRYRITDDIVKLQTKEQFHSLIQSLKEVNELNDRFYEVDASGKFPIIDNDALLEFERKYSAAIKQCEDFGQTLTNAGANDLEINQITNKVTDVLYSDMKNIMNIDPRKRLNLPFALSAARSIELNIGEQVISTAGNALSSRGLVEIPSEDGNNIQGYFTEDYQINTVIAFNKYIDTLKESSDEAKNEYINIIEHMRDNELFATKLYPFEGSSDIAVEDLVDIGISQQRAEQLISSDAFQKVIGDLRETIYANGSENETMYWANGVGYNSFISKRNVGMSRIADMLGMPDILGRATNITIKKTVINQKTGLKEEKITSGVFMENVAGVDPDHVKSDDKVLTYGPEVYDTPQAIESIAKLQVLDYICCNTDRHKGNMILQFSDDKETPVLNGIRGIDNDMSFFLINDPKNSMRICGLESMKVIPEKTYQMVNAITPEMVSVMMKDLSFGKAEIEAVMARIENLKNAVREQKIEVVREDEWQRFKLKDLAAGKNYFNTVVKLSNDFKIDDAKREFLKADRDGVLTGKDYENDLNKLKKISEKLDTTWRDQTQYKNFISALNYAKKLATELSKNPIDLERGQDYQFALENLERASEEYTDYKEGHVNGSRAQNRLDASKAMKAFVSERLPKFKEKLHAAAEEQMEREMMEAKAKALVVKLDPTDIEMRMKSAQNALATKGFQPRAFAEFKMMTMLKNRNDLENYTERDLEKLVKECENSAPMRRLAQELKGKQTDLRSMDTLFTQFAKEENPKAEKVSEVSVDKVADKNPVGLEVLAHM